MSNLLCDCGMVILKFVCGIRSAYCTTIYGTITLKTKYYTTFTAGGKARRSVKEN